MKAPCNIVELDYENVSFEYLSAMRVSDYLDIYTRVGQSFGWSGRLLLNEDELCELLMSDKSQKYLMYFKGNIAGFYELDCSNESETELVYFGLLPEFYGKGLGKYLINSAIVETFKRNIERLYLHTCEFDSKRALPFYEKYGFVEYKQTVEYEYYPKSFLANFLK